MTTCCPATYWANEQHVAGNEQYVARQHVARRRQHVARISATCISLYPETDGQQTGNNFVAVNMLRALV